MANRRSCATLYLFVSRPPFDQAQIGPQDLAMWTEGSSPIGHQLPRYVEAKRVVIEGALAPLADGWRAAGSKVEVQDGKAAPTNIRTRMALLPSNDTHVQQFKGLLRSLSGAALYTFPTKHENAKANAIALGVAPKPFAPFRWRRTEDQVILVANDWGGDEMLAVASARWAGIPTACLQESVIDFGDDTHRMEWADFPLIQGVATVPLLQRRLLFLTGNPRYEALKPAPPPPVRSVLANVNFTYGVFEEARSGWVADVYSACTSLGVEVLFSQHPRDRGDLTGYPKLASSPSLVHDQIRQASLLVTRFSSLIHEAIALGRPVVYYNPHGERLGYDFEPDGTIITEATTRDQLRVAMEEHLSEDPTSTAIARGRDLYLWRHSGAADGQASARVRAALELIPALRPLDPRRLSLAQQLRLYLRYYHRLLTVPSA